jgi:hypothetical protein
MALTMTPARFEEIRRLVREKQLAREAASVDWNAQPAFSDVDEFLHYLDKQAVPKDRPARSGRKRR